MAITLHTFEQVQGAYDALARMGDFMTCADPRSFVRKSNVLLDACIDAGMSHDEPDHEAWAASFITRCLASADEIVDTASRYEVRICGFHSEIYMDGRIKEIISWDRDGSRARQLVAGWERAS